MTPPVDPSILRWHTNTNKKCSRCEFWRGLCILFGIVLMTPAGIFYFSSDNKRRITSFVELLLFSVGAFLLTSSVISMLIGCIRRGQNRRKLASLQITTTNRLGHDAVLQWIHVHHTNFNQQDGSGGVVLRVDIDPPEYRSDYNTEEEAMAMSFDDGLNTPPPDYEEAVKNSAQCGESFSEVANSKSLIFSDI